MRSNNFWSKIFLIVNLDKKLICKKIENKLCNWSKKVFKMQHKIQHGLVNNVYKDNKIKLKIFF